MHKCEMDEAVVYRIPLRMSSTTRTLWVKATRIEKASCIPCWQTREPGAMPLVHPHAAAVEHD